MGISTMPRMMRISAVVFVCAFAGCSWGGDGGTGPGGPDASVGGGGGGGSPVCGDGVCSASEVGSCTSDCGSGGGNNNPAGPVCGNNTCETGETSASCPNDCGGGGGSGSGGGGACPSNIQDCLFCALAGQMCPAGLDMTSCTACLAGGGGGLPGSCNNDGVCDPAEMADPTCADCP